ncbi:MAG: pitrilysin family protein [Candidatus Levyibacteriota bacterium]
MKFQKKILPNGLRVIAVSMPSLESVTALVMVGAGSRYETKKNNGISHFLEHMAFKGTKKRPQAMDIMNLIDGIGGEFNAFTSKEVIGYYIKSASNHIELCLDLLSDILQNSKFDQLEIEKERGVILQEISMYEDAPMRKIGDIYERLVFGNNPLGWEILGEKEVIKSVKRQDFLNYMAKLYSADNMTVIIAGGVVANRAFKLADDYFGKVKRFDTLRYVKVKDKQEKPRVFIKHKKTEQAHIAIGFKTTSLLSSDRYPLAVLSTILGGGASSRLFHEIREKRGLAYFVRTSSEHYQDNGTLVSFAGLDPVKIDEAIKVLVSEYVKIREKGVKSKNELKKAKEFIKGHLVLELEDSRSVAGFYGQQELLEEKIENPDILLKKIDSVTREQIEEVTKKYFTKKGLSLAIIGDFDSRQRFENLLKL